MTLALLALLMVLAAGALAPEMNQLRHFLWLRGYLDWLDARLATLGLWNSEFGLALILLPLLAATALLSAVLGSHLHGLLHFGFALVMLFWCWGPRDLDADARRASTAENAEQRQQALIALGATPEMRRCAAASWWMRCSAPASAAGLPRPSGSSLSARPGCLAIG